MGVLRSRRCDAGTYRGQMARGARNKFGAPMLKPTSSGSKCTVLKKILRHCRDFSAPPSDSAPRGLCPLCPPRCAPGVTLRNKVRSCEIRRDLNIEPLLRIARLQLR